MANTKVSELKGQIAKDMFFWTNGDDYLFPGIMLGEWNLTTTIKKKEDKNG